MTDLPEFQSNRSPIPDPAPTPETTGTAEGYSSSDEGDFDGWQLEEIEPTAGAGVIRPAELEAADSDGDDSEAGIDREMFWGAWRMAFAYPGMVDPDFKPVAIQPGETDQARAACDAAYDLAAEYAPWLLTANEKWFKLAALGQFLFAKVMIVRLVLAEKQARRVAPAGDNDTKSGSGPSWADTTSGGLADGVE